MMELDVCAQHSADAGNTPNAHELHHNKNYLLIDYHQFRCEPGASCSHGLTNASTKGQLGIVEGSYSAAHHQPGGTQKNIAE